MVLFAIFPRSLVFFYKLFHQHLFSHAIMVLLELLLTLSQADHTADRQPENMSTEKMNNILIIGLRLRFILVDDRNIR